MFRVRSIRDGNDICDRMLGSLRSVGDASIFFLEFSSLESYEYDHRSVNRMTEKCVEFLILKT